jgi:hypothetical protein
LDWSFCTSIFEKTCLVCTPKGSANGCVEEQMYSSFTAVIILLRNINGLVFWEKGPNFGYFSRILAIDTKPILTWIFSWIS